MSKYRTTSRGWPRPAEMDCDSGSAWDLNAIDAFWDAAEAQKMTEKRLEELRENIRARARIHEAGALSMMENTCSAMPSEREGRRIAAQAVAKIVRESGGLGPNRLHDLLREYGLTWRSYRHYGGGPQCVNMDE